jgi:hypothetical protein
VWEAAGAVAVAVALRLAAVAEAAERRRRSAEAAVVSAVAALRWVAERALALPRPERQI